MPSRNQTEAEVAIRSRGDTLIDIRPEGPPDENFGMVEALGKAWSWRMQPRATSLKGIELVDRELPTCCDPSAPKREPERTRGTPRGNLRKNPRGN